MYLLLKAGFFLLSIPTPTPSVHSDSKQLPLSSFLSGRTIMATQVSKKRKVRNAHLLTYLKSFGGEIWYLSITLIYALSVLRIIFIIVISDGLEILDLGRQMDTGEHDSLGCIQLLYI